MKLTIILFISFLAKMTCCNGLHHYSKYHSVESNVINAPCDTVQELGSSIMVIYQDKKNVYWFGSWETGVYRYDGKSMINYSIKHGLPNNRIDQITEDQNGNIYFVSCHPNSTITKFDGQSFSIVQTIPSTDWKLQDNDLWLKNAYPTQKVYRFDGTTFYELTLPKPPLLHNPFEIYSIYKDKKGNIWFGTNPVGVCRYDGKSFDWITEEDVTEFRNEGAIGVRSITEDKNGDFWFNTENRYGIYDSTTIKSGHFYKRYESVGSLDGEKTSGLNKYLSTLIDNENNLWFVTYRNGVWKYNGSKITQFKVQENSKDITLFCIYKDNKGKLWLGTHDNGAYKFNGNAFEKFNPKKQLDTHAKIAITIDDVPNTKLYDYSGQKSELLRNLDSLNIPIAIFVNEGLIHRTADTNQNLMLLEAWLSRPYVTLGNHTFSHFRYSEVGYDQFKSDVQKGEIHLRQLAAKHNKPLNYFRFPYNDLGLDSIHHLRIDSLLDKMNYKIAPFTIESADWMFNAVYEYYISNSKFQEAKEIGELYVSKTIELIHYFDSLSIELYDRRINQIYLCHDNALNTKFLQTLIEQLEAEHFEMVSLTEAMRDTTYLQVDHYYKKWGVSWFYRWELDPKKRLELMKKEPDLNQIESVYNALIK